MDFMHYATSYKQQQRALKTTHPPTIEDRNLHSLIQQNVSWDGKTCKFIHEKCLKNVTTMT